MLFWNIHRFPLCANVIPQASQDEADRTTTLKTTQSGAARLLMHRSAFRTVLSNPVTLGTPCQIFLKNIKYFRFPRERAFPQTGDLMSKPDLLLLTTTHRETPSRCDHPSWMTQVQHCKSLPHPAVSDSPPELWKDQLRTYDGKFSVQAPAVLVQKPQLLKIYKRNLCSFLESPPKAVSLHPQDTCKASWVPEGEKHHGQVQTGVCSGFFSIHSRVPAYLKKQLKSDVVRGSKEHHTHMPRFGSPPNTSSYIMKSNHNYSFIKYCSVKILLSPRSEILKKEHLQLVLLIWSSTTEAWFTATRELIQLEYFQTDEGPQLQITTVLSTLS